MEFKGSIVITDPCYITNKGWNEDDYGFDLPENSIQERTGIGDGSWKVYNTGMIDPIQVLDRVQKVFDEYGNHDKTYEILESILKEFEVIGNFCADAGMSCVCDAEALYKYNPESKAFVRDHDWCAAVVDNFEGTVDEHWLRIPGEFEYDQLVFIGKGNINFITL